MPLDISLAAGGRTRHATRMWLSSKESVTPDPLAPFGPGDKDILDEGFVGAGLAMIGKIFFCYRGLA